MESLVGSGCDLSSPLQDVYDKVDYLSSLGKTQTAAVQRDADIGVAEAERDAGIRVSPKMCWASPEQPVLLQLHTLELCPPFPLCRRRSARKKCWMSSSWPIPK